MTKAREFAAAWAKNPPTTREELIALKDAHQGTMDMQKKCVVDFPDDSSVLLRVLPEGVEIDKVFDAPSNTLAGRFREEVGNLLMTRNLISTMLLKYGATRREGHEAYFPDGSGVLFKQGIEDARFYVEKEVSPKPDLVDKPLPTSWGASWPLAPDPTEPVEDTQTGRHDTGDNVRHSDPTPDLHVVSGTDTPKTNTVNPDPKWAARVTQHAMNGPRMTDSEMLEMFADEANWKQVYQDGRCWWAWCGPVLPPWQWIQHARDEKGS